MRGDWCENYLSLSEMQIWQTREWYALFAGENDSKRPSRVLVPYQWKACRLKTLGKCCSRLHCLMCLLGSLKKEDVEYHRSWFPVPLLMAPENTKKEKLFHAITLVCRKIGPIKCSFFIPEASRRNGVLMGMKLEDLYFSVLANVFAREKLMQVEQQDFWYLIFSIWVSSINLCHRDKAFPHTVPQKSPSSIISNRVEPKLEKVWWGSGSLSDNWQLRSSRNFDI